MKKSSILRLYRSTGGYGKNNEFLYKLQKEYNNLSDLAIELCYYIEIDEPLQSDDLNRIKWLLRDPLNPTNLSESTNFNKNSNDIVIEVGPRFNFSTSSSSNAVSICQNIGLKQVKRLEVSRRYSLQFKSKLNQKQIDEIASLLYDRMTECIYTPENIPKTSFNEKLVKNENIRQVDVLGKGVEALKEIDRELGLAFDHADLEYYTNLFKNILKRNPTNVECFDLAQSNSEHSRHWFFKGKLIVDGVEYDKSLIDMIVDTQKHTNQNNVIKFSDNSR